MNFFSSKKALFLLFFALSIVCSSSAFAQKNKKNKKNDAALAMQKLQAQDIFIEAQKAKFQDKVPEAMDLFEQSTQLDAQNDAAYYELAHLYYRSEKIDQALRYIQKAINVDPENKWYEALCADILAINGNYQEASKIYEGLTQKFPYNLEFLYNWAYMLKISGNNQKAIDALNKLENLVGLDESIALDKQRLYMQMGEVEKAGNEIEKLVRAYPDEGRYYLILADLYNSSGQSEKLNTVFSEILANDPNNGYARVALAQQFIDDGNLDTFFKEAALIINDPKISADPKTELLMRGFDSEERIDKYKDEALSLSKSLAEMYPENAVVQSIRGDFLMETNSPELAIVQYRKAVELEPNNFAAWQRLLFASYDARRYEDLEKDTQKAVELYPNQSIPYYLQGLAQTQLKKYDDALKALKRCALIASENPQMLEDVYSQIAEVYNNKQDYAHSDEYFDKVLEINPKNAYALNNYSYYLSLRNENLEKAAEMSKLSNDLQPNNPSFLDTYAWILYQQANYAEALTWIEKAMTAGGSERGVIAEHYGDILFKSGNVDKAVEMWKKAQSLGEDSVVLQQKIANRKM
ncbi:MAG: tetratricopeptide repeat protein [Chitinophagales bacterium]|nr:tetratricopeptide repeat protein [Bacteroidota bacterium]MCB9043434.1 tetratricopeptide repeat protein [Chitinophagales bacterium]